MCEHCVLLTLCNINRHFTSLCLFEDKDIIIIVLRKPHIVTHTNTHSNAALHNYRQLYTFISNDKHEIKKMLH